jgi:hypothetical protein
MDRGLETGLWRHFGATAPVPDPTANDCVILSSQRAAQALEWKRQVMSQLGLRLRPRMSLWAVGLVAG